MSDERKCEYATQRDDLAKSDGEFKEDIVSHRSELGIRTSQRLKVPTVKGKEYQSQLLKRDYKIAARTWQKQANKSEATLADIHTVEFLQQERTKLTSRMDDLSDAYIKYVTEAMPNEASYYDELCDSYQRIFCELDKRISLLNNDRKSVISKQSRRSGKSRKSLESTSSAAQRRIEMVAKAARLNTELKFHEMERERAAVLRKQEDELKRLQITKELAVTQAEIEAVAHVENISNFGLNMNNVSKLVEDVNTQERVERYVENQYVTNPNKGLVSFDEDMNHSVTDRNGTIQQNLDEGFAVKESSQPEVNPQLVSKERVVGNVPSAGSTPTLVKASTYEDPFTKLADLLTERQDHNKLPRPEPEVFGGDFLEYPIWIKAFETFIEGKTKTSAERLYYLGKFTTGEAKEAISGLLSLDSEEAYVRAKKILTRRFGNTFLVSNAYRKKIESWPKIASNDGPGLRRFSDFLQHCRTAMDSIQYTVFKCPK